LGHGWAGRQGLLLILALFSPPSAFPLPWPGFRGGAGLTCLLLAGFAGFGSVRTLRQASSELLLAGIPWTMTGQGCC
jgi:hypothetical protein